MRGSQHEWKKTAMKTLINAAYGSMGAGTMALFADPEAVGTVTRLVRELLDGLLAVFFQAGDGIRDVAVTGVQTCALPISSPPWCRTRRVLPRKCGACAGPVA